MKINKYIYLFAAIVAVSLTSCSEDNDLEKVYEPTTFNVSGKVEKGPFVSGSTITIQPMDENLQVLGSLYSSTIQDNLGNFSFGSKLFEAPYAELMANGYFFNEVEGTLSTGTLNLRALVDLSDASTVNVNLLTHLKYQRIQNLVAGGMDFGKANKQAQNELFAAFGLQKYADNDAATFSIAGGTDESAALIAISSLMLVDRSEAALTEYLAKLCREFGQKGTFDNSTLQQMREDKKSLRNKLQDIRENIIERYEELGLEIQVKELGRFIDWDEDGIAGNETLQDGQEISIETTELNVPNEGGVYTISISSPIPVYLTPIIDSTDEDPIWSETEESFSNLYEDIEDDDISMEKTIDENVLTVKVSPLNSRFTKSTNIEIYDCLGNVLGEIKIHQSGNGDNSMLLLGETGESVVSGFAQSLSKGLSQLCLFEQYYHYNKDAGLVGQYIYPSCSQVGDAWDAFYKANDLIMRFRDADASQLVMYQDYLNVFSALQYYYMVVFWGDVPYMNYVPDANNMYISRTAQTTIFADLKTNLEKAIDNLDEKENESLDNINDFFFISKDVARILLANICMYQHEYGQAELLLGDVVKNGFYTLNADNYNNRETITNLYDNGRSSSEVIFATKGDIITRTRSQNIEIGTPLLVPVMTYTDVLLSQAECLYKNGKANEAEQLLNKVMAAKNISVSGSNVLEKIKDARLQLTLYTNTNFAFMKRNNFATDIYGIEDYRQLLPIPQSDMYNNPSMTQNPGY